MNQSDQLTIAYANIAVGLYKGSFDWLIKMHSIIKQKGYLNAADLTSYHSQGIPLRAAIKQVAFDYLDEGEVKFTTFCNAIIYMAGEDGMFHGLLKL